MSPAPEPGTWARLVAFLNAKEDARPLAWVRILCAATVAGHVGRFLLSGAADLALLHQEQGGLSVDRGWLEALGGATPTSITLLCTVCLLASLSSAIGLFTRPSLILTWLSFRAISGLNVSAHGSYDALLVDTLFVLMLSGCGKALSVDARARGKGGEAARWPRILLIAQLGLLYFGGGLSKASSSWVPGGEASALWFILQQPTWARFPEVPLWLYPFTQVATTLTWIFEITGPLLVFALLLGESRPRSRRLRGIKSFFYRVRFVEAWLLFGLLMHLGIELTMEVGPFSFASMALYPAALGPERLGALRRWLAGLLGRVRGEAARFAP